jgi:hypothetical protein
VIPGAPALVIPPAPGPPGPPAPGPPGPPVPGPLVPPVLPGLHAANLHLLQQIQKRIQLRRTANLPQASNPSDKLIAAIQAAMTGIRKRVASDDDEDWDGEDPENPEDEPDPADEKDDPEGPDPAEEPNRDEKVPEIVRAANHTNETIRQLEKNWIRSGNAQLPGEFSKRKFITSTHTGGIVSVGYVRSMIKRGSHYLNTKTYELIKNP